jgi:hypothetical protein
MPKVSDAFILSECHQAGATGIFILGIHAYERSLERNIRREDIRSAMTGATAATFQPENSRWKVTGGAGLDGVPIALAVVLDRGIVVITIF